mmetsp:Transcript_11415/g.34448  ORF Transcript_11415/g.34448 Transcript_11415/m.34448 type:complete len:225 (-) Transcript_11415:1484-2158(-)
MEGGPSVCRRWARSSGSLDNLFGPAHEGGRRRLDHALLAALRLHEPWVHPLQPLQHHVERGLCLGLGMLAGDKRLVQLAEALHDEGALHGLALVGAELEQEAVGSGPADAAQEHHAGEVQSPQDRRPVLHALRPRGVLQVPELLLQHAPHDACRKRPQDLLVGAELVDQLGERHAPVGATIVPEVRPHGLHERLGEGKSLRFCQIPDPRLQVAAEQAEVLAPAL